MIFETFLSNFEQYPEFKVTYEISETNFKLISTEFISIKMQQADHYTSYNNYPINSTKQRLC